MNTNPVYLRSLLEEGIRTETDTKPVHVQRDHHVRTGRRLPFASQAERPPEIPNLPTD